MGLKVMPAGPVESRALLTRCLWCLLSNPQTLILQCNIKTKWKHRTGHQWYLDELVSFTGVIKNWLFAEFLYCGDLNELLFYEQPFSLDFNFIYLFLAVLGPRCFEGFSLVLASGGYSSCGEQASRCSDFFGFRAPAPGCVGLASCGSVELQRSFGRARAQQSWRTGVVALQQVGSSWITDRTCGSCIGRQTPHH